MNKKIVDLLKKGGVGVLPTDTIYGLVGSAMKTEAVQRIYKLRYRNFRKPLIVLISSLGELNYFRIKLRGNEKALVGKIWPGKVSLILPCPHPEFKYLHRGTNTIAFRLPDKKFLVALLKETGPLVAPSANPMDFEPAKTIREAKKYFGNKVDFYLDAGKIESVPSTLVALENGKVVIKRQGAVVLE